ncbi:DNA polymerase III subunit delta [Clostridium sp.]|uniref:DNA polymerase III subunit delta n=1 Tax=Clostridium sp. TaxID=1506 RepID=UPI003991AA64
MIDLLKLEDDIKSGNIKNSYVLCGTDEFLMKESVDKIISASIDKSFLDLNLAKFDGNNLNFDEFMNACETLPFMADRRAVVMARINFLRDKCDNENKAFYEKAKDYFINPPSSTLVIGYLLLNDKRERANKFKKIIDLDKKGCIIVLVDKLKGVRLTNKIENIFKEQGKDIGKIELKYFSEMVENNFDIIEREVDKLINFTEGREITKEDINLMLPKTSEDDMFDLIEFISQKKANKAIDLINELISKGEDVFSILRLIQEQLKKLYITKVCLEKGKRLDDISRELKLPSFVVEKLINQSRKFKDGAIKKALNISLETEKRLKSQSYLDKKTEIELMVINILI